MTINRREFLEVASAAVVASGIAIGPSAAEVSRPPIKAIAFDAFPVFDPRGISTLAKEMRGEVGEQLAAQWSAKLFAYTWLATSAERYQDFHALARSALRYTADAMKLKLDDAEQNRLIAQYDTLDVWPDVKAALERLQSAGIRLALLSNLGNSTLTANMTRNNIAAYFEAPLSTDRVRRFKPAPEAYAMALGAFGLPREQIGFVAFGGWDAVGATWFGYRTAWINRFGLPGEPVGPSPEIATGGIEGALALAGLT